MLLISLCSVECRPPRRQTCRFPNGRQLQRVRERYGTDDYRPRLHESFGMLRPLRTLVNISREFIDKKQLRIEGDISCPNMNDLSREDQQVCPSYFVMEYDSFRIPDTMVQAQCRCRDCLDDSDSHELRECKKIHYYTRVLRVVNCVNGVYVYDEVWEPISVGCHCVRSRALINNPGDPEFRRIVTGPGGSVTQP